MLRIMQHKLFRKKRSRLNRLAAIADCHVLCDKPAGQKPATDYNL